MKRRPTVRTDRTGRFRLLWEGQRLTVVDSLHPDVQIRAKVTEWQELAEKLRKARLTPPGSPSSKP